jgi:carbamoyl-phosphate synthase large subunit
MNSKIKVLISAAASPSCRSLIVHLKGQGFYIVGMDSNPNASALGEEVCDDFIQSPNAIDEEYTIFLKNVLELVDVFVPFIDEELQVICSEGFPSELKNKIIISDVNSVNTCLNKLDFQDYCEGNEITIAGRATKSTKGHVVCKPIYGRGGKGIIITDNVEIIDILRKDKSYLCQTFIAGQEYTIDCFFSDSGGLLTAIPRKRLLSSGVSVIGAVEMNESIISFVKYVGEKFTFVGLINIQIIVDNDGDIYMVEINPRISGSIIFTILSGGDLVRNAIYQKLNMKFDSKFEINECKINRFWSEYINV